MNSPEKEFHKSPSQGRSQVSQVKCLCIFISFNLLQQEQTTIQLRFDANLNIESPKIPRNLSFLQ
jgi:hypothetical protein